MKRLLEIRDSIYDQFHNSSADEKYFSLPENADAYAAYYTSMYLIQDTGEAVWDHMERDFSIDPLPAYLEFWGVMQAITIQQNAICEIHKSVVRCSPFIQQESSWLQLRDVRNYSAGHPAKRSHGVPATQRTFMGRRFGKYNQINCEMWDAQKGIPTYLSFDLGQLIHDYDIEASTFLKTVLSTMKTKWP